MSSDRAQNLPESCTPIENNLPEGWIEITLDQILQALESGSRPKGGVRGIGEGVPSVGGEHINGNGGFRFQTIKFVPHNFFNRMTQGVIQTGDILVVKDGATTGKVALVRDDFPYNPAAVNEHVFICRPEEIVHPPFLFYFLFSKEGQDRILENFRGSAQGGINQSFAPGTNVPLAPLAEQKRIVAKVEELLPRVNTAKERLAKVSMILKRLRQAVLAAACSGRLTADWREQNPSKESGKYLLELILKERELSVKKDRIKTDKVEPSNDEEPFKLPDPWALVTVGQITKNFDGQRIPVRADDRKKRRGLYNYYGASGIIDSIDAYLFNGEFLLIAEDGANLLSRSTPIAFRASGKFWVNNHAHIVQTYGGIPLQYLEGYLNSIDLQQYVTGSAQPKLTQEALNRIPVPLPPLEEQQEIVRRVEALFNKADEIEARFKKAKAFVDKLTQSILSKAFRGELVPTEAELASREGRSYEPASDLLARIKSERESNRAPEKVRRNRN